MVLLVKMPYCLGKYKILCNFFPKNKHLFILSLKITTQKQLVDILKVCQILIFYFDRKKFCFIWAKHFYRITLLFLTDDWQDTEMEALFSNNISTLIWGISKWKNYISKWNGFRRVKLWTVNILLSINKARKS